MRAQFQAENPDHIEFTITATMTLREWKQLKDIMYNQPQTYGSNLWYSIRDMVTDAEQTFYPKVEENPTA